MSTKIQDDTSYEEKKNMRLSKTIINSTYPKDPLEILGERKFGLPRIVPEDEIGTPIQEFFRDANVFVTGGTGFIGKALIEKLFRSMPHIKHVYVLIRPKRGKRMHERLEDMFEDRLFLRLKQEVPKFLHKVTPIAGDISLPELGISKEDQELLIQNVNIIFHGAATVRFDEKLKLAMAINVIAVQTLLSMAKQMKQLKSFVHVSTAFSHCTRSTINETFYDVPMRYNGIIDLIETLDEQTLNELTPKLLYSWPNTYTFTKAMAEDIIKREGYGLPISIVRPAVIVSSYQEPVRGWIDNMYGPVALMVGLGTGVIHTYYCDLDHPIDMVPVDMVVNSLIATAWKTPQSETNTIPIYNYVGTVQNPVNWKNYLDENVNHGNDWPSIKSIWYYSYIPTPNKYLFYILHLFLHIIPGLVLDGLSMMCGNKPILTNIYKRMTKSINILEYFASNTWEWTNSNVQNLYNELSLQDKEMFFFDMGQMSWEKHAESLCLGLRVYLLKDDIHTLPAARRKWNMLFVLHHVVKFMVFFFFSFTILYLLGLI